MASLTVAVGASTCNAAANRVQRHGSTVCVDMRRKGSLCDTATTPAVAAALMAGGGCRGCRGQGAETVNWAAPAVPAHRDETVLHREAVGAQHLRQPLPHALHHVPLVHEELLHLHLRHSGAHGVQHCSRWGGGGGRGRSRGRATGDLVRSVQLLSHHHHHHHHQQQQLRHNLCPQRPALPQECLMQHDAQVACV